MKFTRGLIDYDKAEVRQAQAMFERALEKKRSSRYNRPCLLPWAMLNVQGKLVEVVTTYEKVLRGREKEKGPDYPNTFGKERKKKQEETKVAEEDEDSEPGNDEEDDNWGT